MHGVKLLNIIQPKLHRILKYAVLLKDLPVQPVSLGHR